MMAKASTGVAAAIQRKMVLAEVTRQDDTDGPKCFSSTVRWPGLDVTTAADRWLDGVRVTRGDAAEPGCDLRPTVEKVFAAWVSPRGAPAPVFAQSTGSFSHRKRRNAGVDRSPVDHEEGRVILE
jgi:hypothetical protein